jgi:MarR family transcriptional regulator for hemolysin
MTDGRERRSRTHYERGPAASPPRDGSKLFGGNSTEVADRHLMHYKAVFGNDSEDYTGFRLTRSIVVAARRWRKIANDHVRQTGQSMARWETMFLVAFSGKGLTQTELARLISVQGPSMVSMLDQLAGEGLITRNQSDVDRRVTVNEITPTGLAAIAAVMTITNGLRNDLLADIPEDKLQVCLEVLDAVLNKLDRMQ